MKNFIVFLISTLVLFGCAANPSVDGAVFTDYIPSLLMIASLPIAGYAFTKYNKANLLGTATDKGSSELKSAKIIAGVALLVFIFGIATYFS